MYYQRCFYSTYQKKKLLQAQEECAKFNSVVGIRVGITGSEKEEEKEQS